MGWGVCVWGGGEGGDRPLHDLLPPGWQHVHVTTADFPAGWGREGGRDPSGPGQCSGRVLALCARATSDDGRHVMPGVGLIKGTDASVQISLFVCFIA